MTVGNNHLPSSSLRGAFGKGLIPKLGRLWDWLISPRVNISHPDLLRQTRLLAAMLLVVVALGSLMQAINFISTHNEGRSEQWMVILSILMLSLAYFLNRSGRFVVAAWITVAILSLGIFAMTFITDGQTIDVDFLIYLFIPLLFTSVFFADKKILLLGALFIAAMLLTPLIPGVEFVHILLGPVSFVSFACGMIYLIFHHRSVLEADRQRELVEKEERYRTLLETSYEGICIIAEGIILDANPGFARMFGYQLNEMLGIPLIDLMPYEIQINLLEKIQSQKIHPSRAPVYRKDGSRFHIEAISRMQTYLGQPAQVIAIRDITERVLAEEALDYNERLYRTLFDGANDAIFLLDLEGQHIAANQKAADMLGYSVDELLCKKVRDVVAAQEYPDALRVISSLLAGDVLPLYERTFRKKDYTELPVEINATLVRNRDGKTLYIQSIVRDITDRKLTEARMRRQLEQLKALREIDRLIATSVGLEITLNIFLNHVSTQQRIDATDIFLFNANSFRLEQFTSRGFQSDHNWLEPVGLNEKLAGKAASERRLVKIADLRSAAQDCPRLEQLARQGFVTCFAVPLIAKGSIKGVLEVFQRRSFEPTEEWVDFLETLGGQAAIAIESAELFQSLQNTNVDLMHAYDSTLEGWAKALELRDKETEGHSQRVTDMTLELGRALGVRDAELVHLRRGAILHDIGKMGIPDSILLKPGPLTEDEWVIMKMHPVYAQQMLASTPFLSVAIDVPYCHHEKWDGSGYPRGLSGEEIPLGARVFALVDVWDALNSDRPYRPAWPKEKIFAYILEQSGKHFDPQAVSVFMSLYGPKQV